MEGWGESRLGIVVIRVRFFFLFLLFFVVACFVCFSQRVCGWSHVVRQWYEVVAFAVVDRFRYR